MSSAINSVKELSAQEKRALLAERLRQSAERPATAPLSFAQQRLWFLDQLEPNTALYNIATIVRIKGNLNTAALEQSLRAIVARHESLRTRFVCEGENPVQKIDPEADIKLNVIDFAELPQAERDRESKALIQQEVNKPFDLSRDLLIRSTLLRFSPDEHRLILIIHHIVADEWSLKIFFNELAALYEGFARGEPAKLEELPTQYADYAIWQRKWLQGETLEKQLGFWRSQLEGNRPITQLPSDRAPGVVPSFNGRTQCRLLAEESQVNGAKGSLALARRLNHLAESEKASLFMVLHAAFQALVYRYTQQEDVIIGSPIAGRNRLETERLIGFFVNTLPLRTKLNGALTFRELLARVREVTLGGYANQDVPFDKLVEELQPERSLNHLPFTRLMFALQNGVQERMEFGGLWLEFEDVANSMAKFDLTLVVQETSRGLLARAEYNTDLFDDATIARLLAHFDVLLRAVAEEPNNRLSDLLLLTEPETNQLLVEWNRTETTYPRDKTVPEIFEAQAKASPRAKALAFGKNHLAYAELNSRANQVAHFLKKSGVGPNIPVAICVERSVEMVIGVLGILKAGGAYVPLDSTYPRERLEFMLADTRAPVLLTQQRLLSQMPKCDAKLICLDSDWELIAHQSKENPAATASPEDLAYVMYTSGSTGQPKGVAVPHRAIVRLVLNTNFIHLDATDRIAQVSNFSFDAATFEIWGALLNGGRLLGITSDIALSPREFAKELREQEITAMFLTAALFNLVAREAPDAFSKLRTMIAGGEALDPKWVRAVLNNHPPERLVNGYGPTENTTFTCCHLIREVPENATNIPIGRPIANTQVFILDQHLNPVPIGVPGELYSAGDGMARGYWNRPDRTASKFILNPFAKICAEASLRTSQHLYRTGDLARYLPSGEIEFLGRIDGQVKIRGFRIELGEIETILSRHEAVRDCVVRVCGYEAEKKRLVAYIVPHDGKTVNVSDLRAFLKEKLPDYMLPSAFMPMQSLPLTPNGKVDRHALPEPDSARPAQERSYVGPRDEIEKKLTEIWEKILGVRPIGIEDRFFDLGGHSLLAVRVMAQIEKAFSKKLRLATIFQKPTIEQLATVLRDGVRELAGAAGTSLVGIQEKGNRPPLFLVHGAGGGMFWGYGNLSRRLGPAQPLYGFKSRGLDGRQEFARIEEMAAAYIADLRALQPHGPYYLGGYCFGGNVSYEIARQLTAQGEEVALLALMNCAPPNSRYTRVRFSLKWAARLLENLVYWGGYFKQWTPTQRREFFTWKLSRVKRKFGFTPHDDSTAADPRTRAEAISDLVDLSSFSGEERALWEAHIRALLDYHPLPFPGKAHLFRSPGHPLWCSFDPDYGWSELAKGGVEIKIVPGAHEKILEEPCVQVVAAELEKLLCPLDERANAKPALDPNHQGVSTPILATPAQPLPSFAQQRLWFLNQLEPRATVYNVAAAWRLRGELNLDAVQKTLEEITRRHEALRQSFFSENGSVAVRLRSEAPIHIKFMETGENDLPVPISQQQEQPFDLANDTLLRATLLKFAKTEHALVLLTHEIAADRTSLDLLVKEFGELYASFSAGQTPALPKPAIQFSQFAASQRAQAASETSQKDLAFWLDELKAAPALIELPADHPRPAKQTYRAESLRRQIPKTLADKIKAFTSDADADERTVMLALLQIVIHRYLGQQDLVVGTVARPNATNGVGNFENLILLRSSISGDLSFKQAVAILRQKCASLRTHQEFPFEKLLEELRPKPDQSYHPLCQIIFTHEARAVEAFTSGSLEITPLHIDQKISKFDLHFHLAQNSDLSELQVIYATDLFNRERIERMLGHFEILLEKHLSEPERPISAVSILTQAEEDQVIRHWNDLQLPYPKEKTLIDLFSEQVARTPDAEALICGETRLTYRQLYARATTLGDRLRALGVGKQTLVGLCLERSWEMVAGILGTLQAGAAYVPMDPAYPRDRLAMMLDDAQVRVLLTQEKIKGIFGQTKADVLCVEDVDFANSTPQSNPQADRANSDDVAYLIYTSGSTGKPKGVALEHRNAVAFVCWAKATFSPEELSGVLASTSICFDLSIFEMFVPLSCGGKVILAENALALPTIPAAHEVKLVNTVPSAMRELLRVKGIPPSVRVVNLAGEPLPTPLVNDIYHETNVQKVYDLYGPTETTTYSTFTLRKPDEPATIGRPLANEQVYLLDSYQHPVPVGVPGEVFIGGAGVTRGYLHRPELTAEKFLPNPFRPGERVYRTGDLARWRPDGNLEFLGRIDNQVKIRGFRIELGEIETVLKKQPSISEALVMARESAMGDKRLVAYLTKAVRDGVQELASTEDAVVELKRALREKLPEYMVPSAFVFLDAFPLTPNGKVDRKALPEPELAGSKAEERIAPRNSIEEQIAAIWREVMGLNEVSVRDNFFDLGGHSLVAIRVVSRMRETFAVEVPLFGLFEAPTIEALAKEIELNRWPTLSGVAQKIPAIPRDGPLEPSFVQERYWFLDQLEAGTHAYNVPQAIRLEGKLNIPALQRALNQLVRRHETLRTTLQHVDGTLKQVIAPDLRMEIPVTDLRAPDRGFVGNGHTDAEVAQLVNAEAQRPFDLARGPLLRTRLIRINETSHALVVVMHHTISDGWSLPIFFRELGVLYDAFASAQAAPPLPELLVQYADYAHWQREKMQGPALEQELGFWKSQLAGAPAGLAFPLDHPVLAEKSPKAAQLRIALSDKISAEINALSQKQGGTPFMVLMSALAITLRKWTGQKDLVLGTVVAGRERRELENVIGCFVNFLPLRVTLKGGETVAEIFKQVKQTVLDAQKHQDCPFEKIVEAINPERRLNQNPLYNAGFVLQSFGEQLFPSSQLRVSKIPVQMQTPLLDLRFEAEESSAGLSLMVEYKTELFEQATMLELLHSFEEVLSAMAAGNNLCLENIRLTQALEEQSARAKQSLQKQTIAIAATFTAEPLEEPLRYWMKELGLPAEIHFAPYNQVFQELLNPESELAKNQRGLNVICLRLEDWQKTADAPNTSHRSTPQQNLKRNLNEFVTALKAAAERASAPFLVCLCPPSPNTTGLELESDFAAELNALSGVYVLRHEEIADWYPVSDYFDASTNDLGHVPYTPIYFTALATAITRKFHALNRLPKKVIALDCDNTLWTGVCGEDGATGVRLEPGRVALQKFIKDQHDSGMLLCICSKNNEEDALEVFKQRLEMPLRRENIVAWRLNWLPKSENLKSLAAQLQLGLDSFILIDDNPVECAEVEANCPEVLTLLLPEKIEAIPQFLNHCWVFDHLKLTGEDRKRAQMYRQQQQREEFRAQSPSLGDFISGLDLKIQIAPLTEENFPRAAQLTQRTNQFNCTTKRLSEKDLMQVCQPEPAISGSNELNRLNQLNGPAHSCASTQRATPLCGALTVSVSDRFGDYGLVGLMVCRVKEAALDVDTFLLSCRVLGRGVEHRMLSYLGEIARGEKLKWVDVHFTRTPKNKPALDFLENVGAHFRQPLNGGYVFRIPTGFAVEVTFHPGGTEQVQRREKAGGNMERARPTENAPATRLGKFSACRSIALELNDPRTIHQQIEAKVGTRSVSTTVYTPPRNELQRNLCAIWEKLLRVERIGIKDDFFQLGGHSLLAVRLFAEVEKLTGRKLPLVTLFQSPTIEQLAHALEGAAAGPHSLLVPLQPHGSRPPLFLIHGAGGDVLWGYANLAAHMPADQPIYGIKSRGQAGLEELNDLQEMAAYYLQEVRAFQPKGPYCLGGYCFGGNVAFEMGRQLREQGEEVALIALLDSAPANAGYETARWWKPVFSYRFARNAYYWLEDFARLKSEDRRRFITRKTRAFLRKMQRRLKLQPDNGAVDLEDVIDPQQFPENELRLWQIHLQALIKHQDKSYPGRVTLFRTRGQPLICSFEEDFCWSKLAQGLTVRRIQGSHENIFMEPNVQCLARELTQCLEDAIFSKERKTKDR